MRLTKTFFILLILSYIHNGYGVAENSEVVLQVDRLGGIANLVTLIAFFMVPAIVISHIKKLLRYNNNCITVIASTIKYLFITTTPIIVLVKLLEYGTSL